MRSSRMGPCKRVGQSAGMPGTASTSLHHVTVAAAMQQDIAGAAPTVAMVRAQAGWPTSLGRRLACAGTHHMQHQAQVCQACKEKLADREAEGAAVRKVGHRQAEQPAVDERGEVKQGPKWASAQAHYAAKPGCQARSGGNGGAAPVRPSSPLPAVGKHNQNARPNHQGRQRAHSDPRNCAKRGGLGVGLQPHGGHVELP